MKSLVGHWSEKDPASALQAVSGPGFERDLETWFQVATSKAIGNWMRKDPERTLQWLSELPVSDEYRGSIEYFLGHEMRGQLERVDAMPKEARQRVVSLIGEDEYAWQKQKSEVLTLGERRC